MIGNESNDIEDLEKELKEIMDTPVEQNVFKDSIKATIHHHNNRKCIFEIVRCGKTTYMFKIKVLRTIYDRPYEVTDANVGMKGSIDEIYEMLEQPCIKEFRIEVKQYIEMFHESMQ